MIEKCTNCEQMKKENRQLRKNHDEGVTLLTEVVNENLALRRKIDEYTNKTLRVVGGCSDLSCKLCLQDEPKTWGPHAK